MARSYHLGFARRIVNDVVRASLRLGIGPTGTYLLTVRGRRTGTPHTTPVTLVEEQRTRWLVAPYGAVGWVQNARAAGEVTLTRGRRSEDFIVVEVGAQEAAVVLQRYLAAVRVARPFFDAAPDAPLASFEAEAPRHPVFRLQVAEPDAERARSATGSPPLAAQIARRHSNRQERTFPQLP